MMKKIIFTSLLLLAFISIQTVSAKDFRSISGSILSMKDPSAPSGGQMSDDKMKTFFGDAREQYVKKIVAIYRTEILEGLKSSMDSKNFLQGHYDNKSYRLINCALIAETEDWDYKVRILNKHLIYYTRAFASVANKPKLEETIAEQRKNNHDVELAKMEQELKETSPEQKESHKAWKKECEIVLKQATDINKAAAPSNSLLLLDFEQ